MRLFFSYSHKDEVYRDELERHLTMLRRERLIDAWHDRKIIPGQDLKGEIAKALEDADIVLFLVSSDFLSSPYCYDVEVARAMERQQAGECAVIPVILRPCDWHSARFGRLLAAPRDALAVSRWDDRDEAMLDIARSVRQAVDQRLRVRPALMVTKPAGAELPIATKACAPATKLLGRIREIETIDRIIAESKMASLDPAHDVGVRFVLLAGESGVGKSALAQYACARAMGHGFEVHAVVCEPFHEGMSLYPMRELARKISPTASISDTIGEMYGYGSSQALMAKSGESAVGDPAPRRDALIASFVNLILGRFHDSGNPPRSPPLLIFIDDLECVDVGTADTLLCLLARAQEGRVVVIGAYRTDIVREAVSTAHSLNRVISAVRRQGRHSAILQLGVIAAKDLPKLCAIMLGGECKFSTEFYRRLYAETEGNPLFIHEVLHTLANNSASGSEPFLRELNGAWQLVRPINQWELPPTIEDAIRHRLTALDSPQREELERAAVIGSRFAFEVMLRLTSSSETELLNRLEAFISLDLIREIDGQSDVFAFSHGKIRGVLYSSMSSLRRRRMHAEVAKILRDLEPALGQDWAAMIGEHLFQAGAFEEACPLLLRAAREAFNLFSVSDAARQFQKALDAAFKSVLPTGEREGMIQLERAESLRLALEHASAIILLERLKVDPDPDVRGRALNCLGDIMLTKGDVPKARELYSECEHIAREANDRELLLEVVADLTELFGREAEHLAALDPETALEANRLYNKYLDEELALAAGQSDPQALGRALRNEAKRLRVQGNLQEALFKYRAAVATEPPGMASHRIMIPYAKALMLAGSYDQALAVIDRVLTWSHQTGAHRSEAIAKQYRGIARWEQAIFSNPEGSERDLLLDASRAELDEALALHEEVGFSNGKRETMIALGMWNLSKGNLSRAGELFGLATGVIFAPERLFEAVAEEILRNGDVRRAAYLRSFLSNASTTIPSGTPQCT